VRTGGKTQEETGAKKNRRKGTQKEFFVVRGGMFHETTKFRDATKKKETTLGRKGWA